jgi:hypothetical protein
MDHKEEDMTLAYKKGDVIISPERHSGGAYIIVGYDHFDRSGARRLNDLIIYLRIRVIPGPTPILGNWELIVNEKPYFEWWISKDVCTFAI